MDEVKKEAQRRRVELLILPTSERNRLRTPRLTAKNIQVEKRYECDGIVKADSEELREIFSNLVVNALQAVQSNDK